MRARAIFLDKDGTLIPNIPYNVDASRIELEENVVEGLQLFQSYGYRLVVISNQDGIARGYFTSEAFDKVKERIVNICLALGIYLDGFYYCPHHPDGSVEDYSSDCDCRKPKPGLLLQAAGDMDIDLPNSWMIGDILNDVEAGNRAGCKSILIDNGNETEWAKSPEREPEYQAKDLTEAARYILTALSPANYEEQLVRS